MYRNSVRKYLLLLLTLPWFVHGADTAINALPAAGSAAAANEYPINEAGTAKKVTGTQIKTFVTDAPTFAAGSSSASTKPKLTSGTLLSTTEAGAMEYDGQVQYFTPVVGDRGVAPTLLMRVLAADATGADSNTAQPWFPSTGAVSVRASTSYLFRGQFWSTRAAGATSHTTGFGFGGTATLTDITWWGLAKEGDTGAIADADLLVANTASNQNVKAASTSTTENILVWVEGVVRINAAGTFIPQFTYSAAPGGAPTIKEGTMFVLYPIGTNTVTTIGTWQ